MGDRQYFDDVEIDLETEHPCAYCEKTLELLDEVLLLQIVYPSQANGEDVFCIVESENGGEYAYAPYFFHPECWDEIGADLDAANEEEEAELRNLNDPGCWYCDSCGAGIFPWETSGLLEPGEFRRSKRRPNGEDTIHFGARSSTPRLYCAACVRRINDDILEMWPAFSHNHECLEGTTFRCWRGGTCTQGCAQDKAAE